MFQQKISNAHAQFLFKLWIMKVKYACPLKYTEWSILPFISLRTCLLYDHRKVKNANTHLPGNVSILRYSHLKFLRKHVRIFQVGNFLVSMVLVCVDSALNHLWFVTISGAGRLLNYEEGNTYDPRWSVLPSGYGIEGEWSHVIAWKLTYTNHECADMHLSLVKPAEIQQRQTGCMLKVCPTAKTPSRHFEHQL
jgi:hypothetical protein